jgi:hypothetical protein
MQELALKLAESKEIARSFNNNKAGRACEQGFAARNTGTFQEQCVFLTFILYFYTHKLCSQVLRLPKLCFV